MIIVERIERNKKNIPELRGLFFMIFFTRCLKSIHKISMVEATKHTI